MVAERDFQHLLLLAEHLTGAGTKREERETAAGSEAEQTAAADSADVHSDSCQVWPSATRPAAAESDAAAGV